MEKVRSVVITKKEDQELSALLAEAERCGFEVEQVIEEIGVLIGSANERNIEKLNRVVGRHSITEEKSVQLPSPDLEGSFQAGALPK